MFGELATAYLFLGGVGAAASAVLAFSGLFVSERSLSGLSSSGEASEGVRQRRRFFAAGYAAALLALVLGSLCLLLDLGRTDRVLLLFVRPTLSFMTLGAYALALSIALSVLLLLSWLGLVRPPVLARRLAGGVLAAAAAVTLAYTALLLGSLESVPLWSEPWVPALFVLSSASGGVALVLLAAHLAGVAHAFPLLCGCLAAADAAVLALELLLVLAFPLLSCVSNQPVLDALAASGGMGFAEAGKADPVATAGLSSLLLLAKDSYAGLFWGGFAAMGLVAPLVLELSLVLSARGEGRRGSARFGLSARVFARGASASFASTRRQLASVAASLCVLAGGFLLRWCIVGAGVQAAALLGV